MKILYAVQGTGNGHLARAIDMYPILCQYGDVEVLVSGIQGDIDLPFPVKYSLYGLSFIFGKHGGVNRWRTFRRMNLPRLIADIFRLPIQEYDLVINDFEPVSAWACKLHKKTCISLSHQYAVLHPQAPKPLHNDLFGQWVLRHYAPSDFGYGFHFKAVADNIYTPVIRHQVRTLAVSDEGYYTVYLPAYDDNTLVKELSVFTGIQWKVFSKHCTEAFSFKNVHIQPIDNEAFLLSMAGSTGVLCGAGFETPAEALFLGKKLLVVPMSGQYEQQCNAACLASMSVPFIDGLNKKNRKVIKAWIDDDVRIAVAYKDNTRQVVTRLMEAFWSSEPKGFRLA